MKPQSHVFFHLFQVLNDLVQGEFMQLGAKETENERFSHYFTKTYRKTASLIANSLKAVSRLKIGLVWGGSRGFEENQRFVKNSEGFEEA
jgi:hypothetical protein